MYIHSEGLYLDIDIIRNLIFLLFSVYNYIPFAQVRNARVTRPFYFLKGLATPD